MRPACISEALFTGRSERTETGDRQQETFVHEPDDTLEKKRGADLDRRPKSQSVGTAICH